MSFDPIESDEVEPLAHLPFPRLPGLQRLVAALVVAAAPRIVPDLVVARVRTAVAVAPADLIGFPLIVVRVFLRILLLRFVF